MSKNIFVNLPVKDLSKSMVISYSQAISSTWLTCCTQGSVVQ